ncbi:MAG TPA: amidohydrolase family protein [Phycisphaerales bacterium]|nr:amidohydrolase family protein [Phycisphaerales bacterium]
MTQKLAFVLSACVGAAAALAQPATNDPLDPQPNGPRRLDPAWHFLVGPTVHVSPERVIESAIVEIRDGKIWSVVDMTAARFAPPPGAQVHDLAGMHVYAGFIDAHLPIAAPLPDRDAPGAHWNASVTPERSALDATRVPESDAERLRKLGFAAAAIAPEGGIFAGRAAVVSLAEPPADASEGRSPVYEPDVYQALSFSTRGPENRGEFSGYPNSEMGAIALIRQTLLDAEWERRLRSRGRVSCLSFLDPDHSPPLVFRAGDELEGLRAGKIAREFERPFAIVGSGYEFRRLDAVAGNGAGDVAPIYIVPLTYPETPDVFTIGAADSVGLRELMTWEQAPTNVRRLDDAGVFVCLTAGGLRRGEDFKDNLEKAIEVGGLEPERALAMLTTHPAELLGVESDLGTVEESKIANLVVATGDLFAPEPEAQAGSPEPDEHAETGGNAPGAEDPDAPDAEQPDQRDRREGRGRSGREGGRRASHDKGPRILDIWIDGERYSISQPDPPFDGEWTFRVGEFFSMKLGIEGDEITATEGEGDDANTGPARKVKIDAQARTISFILDDTDDGTGTYVQSGVLGPDGVIRGAGLDPDGNPFQWTMTRATEPDATEPDAPARATEPDAPARATEPEAPARATEPEAPARATEPEAPARAPVEPDTPDNRAPDAAQQDASAEDDDDSDETPKLPPADLPGYPFGAFAVSELPAQEPTLFTNATIWTSGPAGVIEDGALYIAGGKIAFVGTADAWADFRNAALFRDMPREIDLAGKHVTPGLIDAHSHTGISGGVNEGGQAVTAEVRIGDVTDPDSMNWYRQLAGGVTAVNSMHGSANPIGGQTQTNKIRWGVAHPDDMHMEGAKPGIKFALGENVKQSNWESDGTRYPQSRMGVETIIRDRFAAAREYARHGDGEASSRRLRVRENIQNAQARRVALDEIPTSAGAENKKARLDDIVTTESAKLAALQQRRDLELDAIAEILAGERLVHCHSYRQDEILMLCRVAADFGFKIGTFQHGLEVYKVAEAVKDAAIGASIFSDWWAYKVEVQDAIAQAGPLQHEVGVLTSYNSDSDELARRMNVEAGKAVKYSGGRLTEEEALKFVTINPAIQLGVGDRIGSIEEGKDADLAVWSGPPLSSFSRCEATWIDGRQYFSLERDQALRDLNAEHRKRILQKILAEGAPKGKKKGGEPPEKTEGESPEQDDPPRSLRERLAAEARTRHYLALYLRGIDPAEHRCGDCGMSDMQFGGAR